MLVPCHRVASIGHKSLDEFRSTLKKRWDVKAQLAEEEKEAAKAAKLKEMDNKLEVRYYSCMYELF